MRYVLLLFCALPGVASAQPATRPQTTCDVTIVRAPDDVRPVVQKWIDAEPRCRGSLEVRIIATEGGYYLIARDDRGRTQERVVPDAQSAGVLIASWAADDGSVNYGPPAPTAAPTPEPAPMVAPSPMAPLVTPTFTGPHFVAPVNAPGAQYTDGGAPAQQKPVDRWITFGAVAGPDLGGVRAEIDLKHGAWWTVGVAGTITQAKQDLYNIDSDGTLTMTDIKGVAFAAATWRRGRFELRGAFGLGLSYSKIDAEYYYPNYTQNGGDGAFGIGEMSALAGYQLGDNWGLAAGPVLTIFNQNFNLPNMDNPSNPGVTFHRDVDISFLMGVRHRL